MKKALNILLLLVILASVAFASDDDSEIKTLNEAKEISAATGKPILIEFVRSD